MRYHKIKIIQKGLSKKQNSTLLIRCTIAFMMIITSLFLFLINGNEILLVEKMYDEFGRYTFCFPINDLDYSLISEDNRVKDYLEISSESIQEDDMILNVYSAEPRILDFINADIIEGNFPNSDNEIAVERGLLYRYGIGEKDAIGKTIVIEQREYVVSGIVFVNKNEGIENDKTEFKILKTKTNNAGNEILVQLKDIRNYKEDIDYLAEKYFLDKEKCFVNFELFASIGLVTGDDSFEQDRYIYLSIYFVLLLAILNATFNYINIWINGVKDVIKDMNILGVPYSLIRKGVYISFMKVLLFAISAGLIISTFISVVLWKLLFGEFDYSFLISTYPFDLMLGSILIFILLFFIRLVFVTCRFNLPNKKMKKAHKENDGVFNYNTSRYRFRMFRFNARRNKMNVIIAVISISLSIAAFVSTCFFFDVSGQLYGCDTNMDYRVNFTSEYMLDESEIQEQTKIYNEIVDNKENLYRIWPCYLENRKLDIERHFLCKEYIAFMKNMQEDGMIADYRNDECFTAEISMIGYTDEQLCELCKQNNIEYSELKDNQVIILGNTGPLRNGWKFDLSFSKGETLILDEKKYEIVNIVKQLPVWYSDIRNRICLIVNLSYFKQQNNSLIPESVYIDVYSNKDIEKTESILLGKRFCEITNVREQERIIASADNIRYVLYIVLVIILLCVGNSIISNFFHRYQTNRKVYEIIHLLGISDKDIILIWLYEIIEIVIISIIFMVPAVAITTYYINVSSLGKVGKYIYSFPSEYFIKSMGLVIIMCTVITYMFSKFIKKNLNIENVK